MDSKFKKFTNRFFLSSKLQSNISFTYYLEGHLWIQNQFNMGMPISPCKNLLGTNISTVTPSGVRLWPYFLQENGTKKKKRKNDLEVVIKSNWNKESKTGQKSMRNNVSPKKLKKMPFFFLELKFLY